MTGASSRGSRMRQMAWVFLLAMAAAPVTDRAGVITAHKWVSIGPSPGCCFFPGGETGRATAIAVDPNNADDVWVGTAGGGVWHSSDGTQSWTPMSDQEKSLAIGSIALADCDPGPTGTCHTIFAGTGENAIRRDTYYGAGLLVGSFDGFVVHWTLNHGQTKPPNNEAFDFTYGSINNVVLDPASNGQTVYITLSSGVTASASESTRTAPEPLPGGYGIYKSTNGGATWTRLDIPGTSNFFVRQRPTDLEMSPFNAAVLYAGFLGEGVFTSNDAGATWCPLNPGIPRPASCPKSYGLPDPHQLTFDHVEIATDSTSASHLYATFGQCDDRFVKDCAPAVYETKDGGVTWTPQNDGSPNGTSTDGIPDCPHGYSRYTHLLTIVPAVAGSPEKLYMGGIRLCVSSDHGVTWGTGDQHDAGCINQAHCISHLDHHALVRAPSDASRLYDANDGGIVFSKDGGHEWLGGQGKGLATLEFQSIATSPWNDFAIGGFQDNAGMEWTPGSKLWEHLGCCGDGGFSVMESDFTGQPAPKDDMYITSNTGPLTSSITVPIVSKDGGVDWLTPANIGVDDSTPRSFYAPLVEDPVSHLLYGTQSLFDSTSQCTTWNAISPVLSVDPQNEIPGGQDVISAIGVAPTSQFHIYLGFYSGKIFESDLPCSGNGCWHLGATLPGPVTWIAVDPTDENTAYATISGFTTGSHVYHTDGSAGVPHAWTPTLGWPAELDRVPANVIAVNPANRSELWLGTDHGIYRSATAGGSFFRDSDGLPNVPVYGLIVEPPPRSRVIAATHGRSAWILTAPLISGSKVAGPIHKLVLDQPVFGEGFRPGQACSMKVLRQDGTVCASGSTDALGGSLRTDADGFLVANKAGLYSDSPLVWACKAGSCLGGGAGACDASGNGAATLEISCGGRTSTKALADSSAVAADPGSGLLTLGTLQGGVFAPGLTAGLGGEAAADQEGDPGPALSRVGFDLPAGSFFLVPAVQSGDGTSRRLCRVNVPLSPGETAAAVLQSARDAINADPVCAAIGVSASFKSGDRGPWTEDLGPVLDSLSLQAPGLIGGKLIPGVSASPGGATGVCFSASGLDSAAAGLIRAMQVRFSTAPSGAQGGSLTLSERSPLGQCIITIPTTPGAQAADIAGMVSAAFQATGIPGPFPDCPSNVNPRDVISRRDAVLTSFASDLTICLNDAGVGAETAPGEVCFSNADCDDGNPCTADNCDQAIGQCHSTPIPDGQACDDGNPCTTGNTCQAGSCGTPVICGGGSACAPNVCDPGTGLCVSQPRVCDDGNPCTQDACAPASGQCLFTPTSGASCDDGDPCTANDACVTIPGTAVPICQGVAACNDGDDCTADHCDPATGACVSVPIQCNDGNACTADACVGGTCVSTPLPAGSVCNDTDLCTAGGTCQVNPFTGQATCSSQPVNCDDGDACTLDACEPTTGGCTHSSIQLSEVPPPLQFSGQASFNWPAAPGASFYNTYRGTIPQRFMGSRPPAGPLYDQTCFEFGDAHGDGAQASTDATVPPVGTAFYYLVSEETGCGEGGIGSDWNNTPIPNASPCSNAAPPALQIVKSHSGNFTQGQTGATYALIVSNIGSGPTFGTVTVTELPPSGLTLVSMSGTGWTCPASPGNTCNRSDALAPGASYPPIIVTVDVASNAPPQLANQANVSGGGAPTSTSSDPTTIVQLFSQLHVTKTHTGHFHRGQTGATYTVTVSNVGNAPNSGTVTVTDMAPVGLTNVSMSGTGWNCPSPGSTCTRSDALAAGSSYPDLTVSVDVAPDAPIPSLTNQVNVTGDTSSAAATDPTTIDYPIVAILKNHVGNFVQGQQGAVFTLHVQDQGFGPTVGTITVTELPPAGLTLVSMSGTGWTCPATPGNTCTRSDSLASTDSYPDITATVNVASNAPSSVTNEADAVGGGSVGTAKGFDFVTIDTGRLVLSITKSHSGNFVQGQPSATYTLTVHNAGNLPTSGTVTVTENAPAGLTLQSMAGTGWTCPSPGNTCTRSDALAPGANYPDITVTVSVAVNAPTSVTNQATVTGGGDATLHTANDPTTINEGPPILSVTKTHNGNFSQGQTNAKYTVTISNVATRATAGPVSMNELPPSGLTVVSMSGTGWTCDTVMCNRPDPLPGGASYPAITITVSVAAGASSPQVNQVMVNGGGAPPANASDSTIIIPAGTPALTITKTHVGSFAQGQTGATYTLTVSNNIGAGPVAGPVTVQEIPPSGLAPVSMAGTGWTCNPTSCNRNTALAPGASYPPITVTVNVLATATSPQINQARVSGGGAATVTTSDPTVITP